jgi:hypothetical protein
MMAFSFSGSKLAVPSSSITTDGFLIKALANIILYFYPPDKFPPFSVIIESYPLGNCIIKL